MKRVFTSATFAALLASCSPVEQKTDYALQWDSQIARLIVRDETGRQLAAFEEKYLALPGFVFSRGQIRLHPGKQRVGYICPRSPGDVEVLDVAPSLVYNFEAGKQYELVCIGGAPRIRQLDNAGL